MGQNQSLFSNGSEYLIGVLFGLGLMISGMTNPAKILAFLDLAGNWDPSLIFVMGGAVLVTLLAFAITPRPHRQPWLARSFKLPTRTDVDLPLVLGAALFGVGWGLGGAYVRPSVAAVGVLDYVF